VMKMAVPTPYSLSPGPANKTRPGSRTSAVVRLEAAAEDK
jgi:hypothetical protein